MLQTSLGSCDSPVSGFVIFSDENNPCGEGSLGKKSKPSKIEDWLSFTQSEQSERRMKNVPCDTVTQNKDALAKKTVPTPSV